MAPQDSWKVTTDHRLIAESLQSSLKQRDFTIIESRQNGEAESFMKLLNKTEQIAHLKGRNSSIAIQEMATLSQSKRRLSPIQRKW